MSAYDFSELYTTFGKNEKQLCKTLAELAGQYGNHIYQQLFRYLFNLNFRSDKAYQYWHEALQLHPPSDHLNHRAALLNYLIIHTDELDDPRIIESDSLKSLTKSAVTDGLTGLYNQLYFKQQLRRLIIDCNKQPGSRFSLFLFDLDHFKQFNDRGGHLRADLVLKTIGRLVQASTPQNALAARYEGEKFAVLLPDCGLTEASNFAEQIRSAVEKTPFDGEARLDNGNLTISGGIACYPEVGKSVVSLLAHAENKLCEAKHTRNCISPSTIDTRSVTRHIFRSIVELRNTSAGTFKSSLSADISYTGVLLKSDQAPAVGKQIELRFPYPFWPNDHTTTGRVRHVRSNESPNNYLIGVEFSYPQVDFIEKILPEDLFSSTPH